MEPFTGWVASKRIGTDPVEDLPNELDPRPGPCHRCGATIWVWDVIPPEGSAMQGKKIVFVCPPCGEWLHRSTDGQE